MEFLNVSIIIPCRNEEKFIGNCLDSILKQSYPKEKIEVLVVDGMSDDKTRKILKEYIKKYHFIKLLDNPARVTPKGMNLGIENSRGEVLIFLNSHSVLDGEFLKWTIYYLNRKSEAMAIGGKSIPITEGAGNISKTITLVLSSVFEKLVIMVNFPAHNGL